MRRIGRLSKIAALSLSLANPIQAQTNNGPGTQFELAFWQSVAGSDDPALYEAYLEQYPTGTFSGLARAKLASLRRGATPGVPQDPAPSTFQGPSQPTPASLKATILPQPLQPKVLGTAAQNPVSEPSQTPIPTPATLLPASPRSPVQPSPRAAASQSDDAALLEALAKSQELGGSTLSVSAAQGFSIPVRPVLQQVPEMSLPASFCSAEQRNSFHENSYKPVMEIARVNNELAVAHMQRLQQIYDSLQLARDPNPMNAIADEAIAYQRDVARPVYKQQLEMVDRFAALMAVPIASCEVDVSK